MLNISLLKAANFVGLSTLLSVFLYHQELAAQHSSERAATKQPEHLYTEYHELGYSDEWYGRLLKGEGSTRAIRLNAEGKVGGGGVLVFWCEKNADPALVWFDDVDLIGDGPDSYSTKTELSSEEFRNLSVDGWLYDDNGDEVYFRLPPAIFWVAKAKFC